MNPLRRHLAENLEPRLDTVGSRDLATKRSFVGQVVSSSPAVGKFITVNPVRVLGTETDGSAATIAVATGTAIPVYLVGPGVPATGDQLVCRWVSDRWVASRATGSGSYTRGYCHCTFPSTLTVTFDLSDYFAAPNIGTVPFGLTGPWTLNYGPAPTGMPTTTILELEGSGLGATFSNPGWFSAAIPGGFRYSGITSMDLYVAIGFSGCAARLITLGYLTVPEPSPWFCILRSSGIVHMTTCVPFNFSGITGTHSSSDIVPDSTGTAAPIF